MKLLAFMAGTIVGAGTVLALRTRVALVRSPPGEAISTDEFDALWDSGVALMEGSQKDTLSNLWEAFLDFTDRQTDE